MDYALLAATALGAIGLYLMLPRERLSLVRLGGLLGTMAVAGFFLYLVRTAAIAQTAAATAAATTQPSVYQGPPIYFYLFSAIMIAGAVGVVCQPKPVYAALYFVLVTLAGAGLFVLLLAEFMAIVLIIIYAGAILVTYVFVIMLASQGSTGGGGTGGDAVAPAYDRRSAEPFASVLVAFVLVGGILQVLLPTNGNIIANRGQADPAMVQSLGVEDEVGMVAPPTTQDTTQMARDGVSAAVDQAPSNVQLLGMSLYSRYGISLELAGVLLTVALIGAVVIARKGTAIEQVLGTGNLPTE